MLKNSSCGMSSEGYFLRWGDILSKGETALECFDHFWELCEKAVLSHQLSVEEITSEEFQRTPRQFELRFLPASKE